MMKGMRTNWLKVMDSIPDGVVGPMETAIRVLEGTPVSYYACLVCEKGKRNHGTALCPRCTKAWVKAGMVNLPKYVFYRRSLKQREGV